MPSKLDSTLAAAQRAANERADLEAKRFRDLTPGVCSLCHANGAKIFTLRLACSMDFAKIVPEMIMRPSDERGVTTVFVLPICGECRERLTDALAAWRAFCRRSTK